MSTPTAPAAASKPFDLKKEIARRNKLFRGATKAQKRVLIAKDVIEQFRTGKFSATRMTYLELTGLKPSSVVDVQTVLLGKKASCKCCGLGAVLASSILFNDKVKVGADGAGVAFLTSPQKSYVDAGFTLSLFGEAQLSLIEYYFEGWKTSKGMLMYPLVGERAFEFRREIPDDEECLIAIMTNIIKNKGTFRP